MGQPVVHFEIIGKDAEKLKAYYEALFGWNIDSNNPINYGMVPRERNVSGEGVGIGGGIAAGPEGYPGHVTFYVAVLRSGGGARQGRTPGRVTGDGPRDGDGPDRDRPLP
jgi:predicted enzyme related to lactoylglutathione lyase